MVDVNSSEDKQQDIEERDVNTTSNDGDFLSSFFSIMFCLILASTFLWNWDGFWQTNIDFLAKAQKEYFPSKFSEEQLKTSRVTRNNVIIDDIRNRQELSEARAKEKLEQVILQRDKAIAELNFSKNALNEYLDKENTKCRYYDTSLRMIDHLTKKYSEDELERTLSCTSSECEKILYTRLEATAICN